jgi:agmatinase
MTHGFDPNAAMIGGGIYGLPHTPDEAEVVLIPVPWEATVTWGTGTRNGPQAILDASRQIDLQDRETGTPYERGIAMLPIPKDLAAKSDEARRLAEPVVAAGGPVNPELAKAVERVDALCEEMNAWVYNQAEVWLEKGKLVGAVGGDHSIPYGLIRAMSERHPGMGILHFDAHADLRNAYEGFTWSHASIMYNVVERLPGVAHLVQVGIRDFSPGENELIEGYDRIQTFFEDDLRARLLDGETFSSLASEIVAALPETVYVSFDIDGLDPKLCPHTGTPVPGGLAFAEATAVIRRVASSGRKIVGFDLNEVAPDPRGESMWDGNVGAHLLYKMIGFGLMTR